MPVVQKSNFLSLYRETDDMEAFSGMWHAHVQGGFPGFAEAREICRRKGFGFLGVTEHDNRYIQMEWSEKDWYSVIDDEFIIIRGFEATHPLGHITCLGFLPEQTGVDAYAAYSNRFKKENHEAGYTNFLSTASKLGAFLALNHPFKWRGNIETLIAKPDFNCLHAMEIYNGNNVGKKLEQGYTIDLYDECLSLGHRIWCGANPDCHSWDVEQYDSPYNGYSVVYAESLTREAILDSLKNGRFYASSGLELNELKISDSAIEVASERSRKIRFYGRHGVLLEEVESDHAEYRFRGDEGYVRAELEGEPAENSRMTAAQAWLQPVWVE